MLSPILTVAHSSLTLTQGPGLQKVIGVITGGQMVFRVCGWWRLYFYSWWFFLYIKWCDVYLKKTTKKQKQGWRNTRNLILRFSYCKTCWTRTKGSIKEDWRSRNYVLLKQMELLFFTHVMHFCYISVVHFGAWRSKKENYPLISTR